MWYLRLCGQPDAATSRQRGGRRLRCFSLSSLTVCFCAIFVATDLSPAQDSPPAAGTKPKYAGIPEQNRTPPSEEELRARTTAVQIRLAINDFRRMLDDLVLSDAQEQQIITWFMEYDDAVRVIEDKALDEMVPNFHAQVVAEYSDQPWTVEQKVAAGKKRRDAKTRAEAEGSGLLAGFFENSTGILGDSQSRQWSRAVHAWRRSVMLNPLQHNSFGRDLGEHIDLFEIAAKLAEDEPALRPFLDRDCDDQLDETAEAARGQCMELLRSFEIELNQVIQVVYRRRWQEQYKSLDASTRDDQDAHQKCRRKILADWLRVYHLNTTAAETLSLLIEEASGRQSADAWRDHYYAAYYPKLYAERTPDLLYEWLHNEAKLAPEQLEFIEVAFEQFLEQRRQVRAESRRLLVDLIKELNMSGGRLVLLDVSGQMPPKKAALIERRRELDDRTAERFRSILTDQQRESFDAARVEFQRQVDRATEI